MMFKFKVGDDVRILKYKNIFAKGYTPNWSEAKLETQLHVLMLLVIKMVKKLLTFYEEELHKTNQEEFRIKNVFKEKETSYMSNRKDMIIRLIFGLIKKTLYKMS